MMGPGMQHPGGGNANAQPFVPGGPGGTQQIGANANAQPFIPRSSSVPNMPKDAVPFIPRAAGGMHGPGGPPQGGRPMPFLPDDGDLMMSMSSNAPAGPPAAVGMPGGRGMPQQGMGQIQDAMAGINMGGGAPNARFMPQAQNPAMQQQQRQMAQQAQMHQQQQQAQQQQAQQQKQQQQQQQQLQQLQQQQQQQQVPSEQVAIPGGGGHPDAQQGGQQGGGKGGKGSKEKRVDTQAHREHDRRTPPGESFMRGGPGGAGRGKGGRDSGKGRKAGDALEFRGDEGVISDQLLQLVASLMPSEEETAGQRSLIQQVESALLREWPRAKVHLFGSCANTFAVRNATDIDLCLQVDVEDSQDEKAKYVERVAELLEGMGMEDIKPLTHARVPICKFRDPVTRINCDVCINNILAVVNTRLLRDYASIDPRLRQLAFCVKYWAKRRQINETYRGTLSSYCYVLMAIHHLQQRSPPVLPCLQSLRPVRPMHVNGWDCSYFTDVQNLPKANVNQESLARLLAGFFDYWAWRHDYSNAVVSVRTGGFVSKARKEWTRRVGNERHLICIEDPFETSHDLGRVVDRHSIGVLRDEFCRAAKILREEERPLEVLFEVYKRSGEDLPEGEIPPDMPEERGE